MYLYLRRFDKFTATLAKTAESVPGDGEDSEHSAATATTITGEQQQQQQSASATTLNAGDTPGGVYTEGSGVSTPTGPGAGGGGDAAANGGGAGTRESLVALSTSTSAPPKKPSGREWLRTHPHGRPPTMKLAMQFDQVCLVCWCRGLVGMIQTVSFEPNAV